MLLVHPVQEIPRAIPALLGVSIAGTSGGHAWWGLVSLVIVMAAGVLRWFTTTYRITPEYVQVRKGLVRRKSLSVPRDRVRTVDVTAHAIHRIVGLTRVTVGTGRSDRKDEGVRLDGLSAAEAVRLREDLLHLRPTASGAGVVAASPSASANSASANSVSLEASADPEVELARLQPGWVRYGPFTLSGFVAIGVIAAFASRAVNEAQIDPTRFGPTRALGGHLQHLPLGLAIAEVVAACLIFVAIASAVGYVLAFWRFRLTRHAAGTLHVTRGLITSRATTIEERRLRGVEVSEPLLLRAVGGARCIAIATGLRVGRGAERGGTLLLPPAPLAEVERVAVEVLRWQALAGPRAQASSGRAPVASPLIGHGRRARRRRYTRALGVATLVVAALFAAQRLIDGPAWMWEASLLLLPIAALLARDRYRSLGHALVGGWLVTRQGSLVRRRCALSSDGIVGWNLHQSLFQRRAGLATLTATTAAGRQRYEVSDVDLLEAVRLADRTVPDLLTPFLVPAAGPRDA
jgi:putative membrane protein